MKRNLPALVAAGAFALGTLPATAQLKTAVGTDIMLPTSGNEVYSNARVSVSYTGSIYAVRLVAASASANPQVWQLLKSTDNGSTWSTIATSNLLGSDQKYTAIDVVAVGSTPATHRVFVARSSTDSISQLGAINFSSYDSLGGNVAMQTLPASAISIGTSPRGYTSVALASDTREPSEESITEGGYAISLAAVKDGIVADSVIAWTRLASATVYARRALHGTATAEIRSVSASVGSLASSAGSLGRFPRLAVAWDEFANSTAAFGTSRVRIIYADDAILPTISGPYQISTTGNTRRPQVVLSADTGATELKALVAYEVFSTATDFDVNARVDTVFSGAVPTFAENPSIADELSREFVGGAAYNPATNEFIVTYFNEANNSLGYATRPYAAASAVDFATVIANYRDATTPLVSTYADVDINVPLAGAAFAWTDAGRTMFDAEYRPASSIATPQTVQEIALFPNPATDRITLRFRSAAADASALYSVVDMAGRTVLTGAASIQPGDNVLNISLGTLPTGVYTLSLRGAQTAAAARFSVR